MGVKTGHNCHTFVASPTKQAPQKDIGKQITAIEIVTKGTNPCLISLEAEWLHVKSLVE